MIAESPPYVRILKAVFGFAILATLFVGLNSVASAQPNEDDQDKATAVEKAPEKLEEEVEAPTGEEKEAGAPETTADFNGADVAWMLTSCALVLMMTGPGLALFYGGLVRKKNILSVLMQCLFMMGIMSVVWVLWGYSLAFGGDMLGGFVGNFDKVLLNGVLSVNNGGTVEAAGDAIPESLFMVFQMMFFIITPALICGAFAERMKFSAMVLYSVLWGTFVYCPIAHWVWSENGWLLSGPYEALDFAGGTVVHMSSGFSALVCCIMLGKRIGHGDEPMPPHNLTYTVIGTCLLWVGWFGFNAGSALSANLTAVNAFVATHLAAAAGLLVWSAAEWILRGKPSVLGACSGAVAGLVCITPASGSSTALAGIIIGGCGGLGSFIACTSIKNTFKYDDSLDVFGVHGVSGIIGCLLTGVFASASVTGGAHGLIEGNSTLIVNQAISIAATAGIAIVGTVVILLIVGAITGGIRVKPDDEIAGLDLSQHGEDGYIFQ